MPRSRRRPICCKATSRAHRAPCGAAPRADSAGRRASRPRRSCCTSARRSRSGRGCAIEQWQADRAIVATARNAGAGEHPDADAAARALARTFADARHRAGLAAPADALPLLARAAPTLAALPAGALKSATYASGTWTFELAKLDADAQTALDRGLAAAGVASLQATTAAGTRVRATLGPGTERP